MNVHGGELFCPGFRVALAGLFVAPLMVTECFLFLVETTLSGGRGEICRLQPRVDRASDLLHRELPYLRRRRILLTDTGTEQVRELRARRRTTGVRSQPRKFAGTSPTKVWSRWSRKSKNFGSRP
jgi:hypothetical protein